MVVEWDSPREKYTIYVAIGVAIGSLFIVTIALCAKDVDYAQKIALLFNPFTGAALGYLFGYVPTKSSEIANRKENESLQREISELKKAIEAFQLDNRLSQEIINDYSIVIEKLRRQS
jgi:hypothetical protein